MSSRNGGQFPVSGKFILQFSSENSENIGQAVTKRSGK